MITYNKISGFNNAAIGKIETPIKMIIQHESDLLTAKGGICDALFNVETSSRFGETIIGGNEFNVFNATVEGEETENNDFLIETYRKFIEHIQFMKEFVITAEMMEDANFGIAQDAKHRAETFVRAYYRTINGICSKALADATVSSTTYANTSIDLTTADGIPLFSKSHEYGKNTDNYGTQSNYFYGDVFGSGTNTRSYSTDVFEESLSVLANKIRCMRDENGNTLGYTADTLILPGNHPKTEAIAKKVCGSAGSLGNGYNDINLHYGNWNIVVLPDWTPTAPSVMVMSSEANKNLCGNMFFNRVPLTITNWVDNHTGNYIWNGRCRFGVGFGTYKHILLAVDSSTAVASASAM